MFRVLLLSLGLLLVGCSGLAGQPEIVATVPPRPTPLPVSAPVNAPSVELGAGIFAENCVRCHGIRAEGDGELVLSGQVTTPMINFTLPSANDDKTPLEWFDIITNGNLETLMPPWAGSLSANERWSAAMYLYTLAYPPDATTQGKMIYADNCAECHGDNGRGDTDVPSLLDLYDWNDSQIMTRIQEGSGEDMPAFADDLTSEEQTAVIAYVRSFSLTSGQPALAAAQPNTDTQASASESVVTSVGMVSGSIIHGTDGGVLPDGMTATLHIIGAATDDTIRETTVNDDGSFAFEDVQFSPDNTYIASVTYNNGSFVSDFTPGTAGMTSLDLPITVYDLTYDPSVMRINGIVSQVFNSPNELQVIEIIELWNDSDRIFMGEDETSGNQSAVTFNLPENAQYLTFTGEDRYSLSPDGRQLIDSQPILPREAHVIHMAYSIPYDGKIDIKQTLEYPLAGRVEVHVQQGALTARNDAFVTLGTFDTSGTLFTAYGADMSLAAGDTLQFELASLNTTTSSTDNNTLVAGGLMLVGVVLVVSSGVLVWRDRRTPKEQPKSIDDLTKDIAALDALYEAGEIPEAAYKAHRKKLKAQITALMKK